MKHLIKRIAASKSEVLGQFKTDSKSFKMVSSNGKIFFTVEGHDVLSYTTIKNSMDKIAHLIRDIIAYETPKAKLIKAYMDENDSNLLPIVDDLKNNSKIPVKFLKPVEKIPLNSIQNNDIMEFDGDQFKGRLKDFSIALHDLCEILRVCREDCLSLTSGQLVSTMWGAKPMQQILTNLHNEILINSDWDRIEFHINILIKSIERILCKLQDSLPEVGIEEKKVINTVLIPNIIQSFDHVKDVVSSVLITLSNLIYIDEVFKRITEYPACWFINGNMLEDLSHDYEKLIMFILRIPSFESGIIYPLDMMKHNFVK